MKPSILILMHYLELGGAEISLIGLLNALDPLKVDVDMFLYSHQGELIPFIPKWVNLLPEVKVYSMIEKPIKEVVLNGCFGVAKARVKASLNHRKYKKNNDITGDDISIYQYIGNEITQYLPNINPDKEYDLCISYLLPHNIGLEKVRAKKRLAWIHTDYSTVHVNSQLELPVWNGYDHIASISPDVKRSFLSVFPSLADKIVEIENIHSPSYVQSRTNELDVSEIMSNIDINLLSIGRFSYAKNYDNVPDIARRIIKMGCPNLKWYIIGFGGNEALIRDKIVEAEMEDHVILLGKKDNPYPYIKACDIYIQPSRYEGKSVTVRESQMLCKPVVVTNYPTASSQIKDGVDGIIVPLENEGCAEGIIDVIKNMELQRQLAENCSKSDFSNEKEVDKIYTLLGI